MTALLMHPLQNLRHRRVVRRALKRLQTETRLASGAGFTFAQGR